MRIGFDARAITHPRRGGFKTYSTSLCHALAAAAPDDDLFVYTDRRDAQDEPPTGPRVHVRVVEPPFGPAGAGVREQWSLPRAARRDRLDVFHAPNLTAPLAPLGCPLVLSIHDMQWLHWPDDGGIGRRLRAWYFGKVPALASRRAAAVIVSSNATRQDVLRDLSLPPERVTVVRAAAGERCTVRPRAEVHERLRKLALGDRFVLALGGSADPRKNLPVLLEAFAGIAPRLPGVRLAIVWTGHAAALQATVTAGLGRLQAADRFHHVIAPDDDTLVDLYNACEVFALPSEHEGLGLPVLEAMACGAPVVAADTAALPEMAGPAGVLVPVRDPAALGAALEGILADPGRRGRLSEAGLVWARGFTWRRAAEQTLSVYRAAAARGTRVRDMPVGA